MRIRQNRYFGLITFLAIFAVILATTGCARYARQVSIIYDPAVSARGGYGDLYIVIPPDQQPRNNKIKWVIGNVNNYDGSKIDEIMSLQSPSELVRDALGQELRKAGFTVIHATSNPATQSNILNLINVDLSLDQQSDIVDIKANCRLIISIDVFKNGVLDQKTPVRFHFQQKRYQGPQSSGKDRFTGNHTVRHAAGCSGYYGNTGKVTWFMHDYLSAYSEIFLKIIQVFMEGFP